MGISMLKINTKDGKELLMFSSYDPPNKLYVKLLDVLKNEAYSGDANEIDLRSMAANIRMAYNIYIIDTQKALCHPTSEDEEFLYSLDKNDDCFSFKWRKKILSEDITISLGHLNVRKINFATILSDIWMANSQELIDLNNKIKLLNESLEKSENQRLELGDLLSVASEAKDNLEKELFSKFVKVLNNKKHRIKEMEKKIKSGEISSKSSKHIAVHKMQSKRVASKAAVLSDSSEADDEIPSPKPSTSNSNGLKRQSLNFFDDAETEQSCAIKKSKVRNRKVASKSTLPSKTSYENELSDTGNPLPSKECDSGSNTDELLDFM